MLEFEIFGKTVTFVYSFFETGLEPMITIKAFWEAITNLLGSFFG